MSEQKKKTFCRNNCGTELHFDKNVLSKNGKLIPLEIDGQPHQCPNKEQFLQQDTSTQQKPQPTNDETKWAAAHIVELVKQVLKELESMKQ